jgi:hypothetical protein
MQEAHLTFADTPQRGQIPNDRLRLDRMDANARSLSPDNRLFLLRPSIAIAQLSLALAALSMQIMPGARAHVSGESEWGKGQRATGWSARSTPWRASLTPRSAAAAGRPTSTRCGRCACAGSMANCNRCPSVSHRRSATFRAAYTAA